MHKGKRISADAQSGCRRPTAWPEKQRNLRAPTSRSSSRGSSPCEAVRDIKSGCVRVDRHGTRHSTASGCAFSNTDRGTPLLHREGTTTIERCVPGIRRQHAISRKGTSREDVQESSTRTRGRATGRTPGHNEAINYSSHTLTPQDQLIESCLAKWGCNAPGLVERVTDGTAPDKTG